MQTNINNALSWPKTRSQWLLLVAPCAMLAHKSQGRLRKEEIYSSTSHVTDSSRWHVHHSVPSTHAPRRCRRNKRLNTAQRTLRVLRADVDFDHGVVSSQGSTTCKRSIIVCQSIIVSAASEWADTSGLPNQPNDHVRAKMDESS